MMSAEKRFSESMIEYDVSIEADTRQGNFYCESDAEYDRLT